VHLSLFVIEDNQRLNEVFILIINDSKVSYKKLNKSVVDLIEFL
jgi:hypothetical protein